jgi:deazaflavin-dependent oxidoreductase (nitroreductase family)
MSQWKSPIIDGVRGFNKHVLNPAMMHLAGSRYWYASVISHIGRHSGTCYGTPVVAEPTADGFLVPLPYGARVDWLRNVLAAGRATVRSHGRTYDVVEPLVIDAASAAPMLSARRRRVFGRFGIDHFLVVKTVTGTPPGADVAAKKDGMQK